MSAPQGPHVPRIPEFVGATDTPFQISGLVTNVSIGLAEAVGPASVKAESLENWAPRRVFLNIERMRSEVGSPPMLIYINVPEQDNPVDHPDLLAGELSTFGLLEASISDEAHTPGGLVAKLEITELYARLSQRHDWDGRKLRVSFVSRYGGNLPTVDVGRASVYFA